jgi:N-carbamoyl-L-amino-acid hydrolase
VRPRIDGQRLQADLARLAEIGATPNGGVTRLALSDEDRAGRDRLRAWMEEAGLQVRIDDFGNITGRRAGSNDGPALLLASHIDTVRDGGHYDGAYGVLAALAVVRALNDAGITTRRPIEVVSWTNEEGVRFEPAMLCSGAVAGRFAPDYVAGRTDRDGTRFGDELQRIGYAGSAADRPGPAAAYLELHIEQGPVLEGAGLPVGVVEGIVGITWFDLVISGRADHAGPSPMTLRQDALAAAAQVVAGVEAIAREVDGAVGTVGRLTVEPNSINTIPGRVVMSADFRHPEPPVLETLVAGLEKRIRALAAERRVEISVDRFWTSEPTPFDPAIVDAVAAACEELDLPHQRLWSGAGHDAKYAQELWPSAMIFVRSQGGLSHSPREYSTPADLEAGANVLLTAALRLTE